MYKLPIRSLVLAVTLLVTSLSACSPDSIATPTNLPLQAYATQTHQPTAVSPATMDTPEPTSEPTATQAPTSEPTVDPGYQALVDYFLVSAAGECRKIEDGSPDTVVTAACKSGGSDIQFDQFSNSTNMNAYLKFVKSEYPRGEEQNWTDACTSSLGGTLYTFFEVDGSAWLVWSVKGQNFTGEAVRADGDMDALKAWWETEGVQHPCP